MSIGPYLLIVLNYLSQKCPSRSKKFSLFRLIAMITKPRYHPRFEPLTRFVSIYPVSSTRSVAMSQTRDRIIRSAARLLDEGGREAVSTRAVSAAARVQAPTIYRIFGDKQGLLDTVAIDGYTAYLGANGQVEAGLDPVDDLRRGWDLHVDFGLAHPQVYSLIYGQPRSGDVSPAVAAASKIVGLYMHRIAGAGRLRISEDAAVQLANALGSGTVLTLIALAKDRRDRAISDMAREAMIAAVTTDAPLLDTSGPVGASVAFRALLPQITVLTPREVSLMSEWLDRIAESG